jgi:hypothetical protein
MMEALCSICRGPAHPCPNCGCLVPLAPEDRSELARLRRLEAAEIRKAELHEARRRMTIEGATAAEDKALLFATIEAEELVDDAIAEARAARAKVEP